MALHSELFIIAVALLIVASVCLGLLVALAVFVLGGQRPVRSPANANPSSVTQSKIIADTTMKMTVGLMAIVFSATFVPMEANRFVAAVLVVGGLAVVILSWYQFRRI